MIRRSKEKWLSLFQQQIESGLSAAEFCKQNNLCDKHFSVRKKQLSQAASVPAEFVPVVVQPRKARVPAERSPGETLVQCRIGNCLLQFESLPEVAWLTQVLKALA